MKIIIAIDIIEGKCVRLTKGDYSTKKIYNEDPLEVAKMIENSGLKYLHLVDLDGAKNKRIINSRILEKIAVNTNLTIDFGGGVRSEDDLKIAFSSGAGQVTGGSIAVNAPSEFIEWIKKYGNEKIILGADCKNGKIATEGWTEHSDLEIIPFISGYTSKGLLYSICTDVDKDGMMNGPAIGLYKRILKETKIKLIASGGISSLKNVIDIKDSGCEGVIIGKAIYEGKIKLKELSDLC